MSISLILLVLFVFTALVAIHEFGHFIVAKKNGVRVDEYAIGFPPRLFSKKIGETEYSLNLLPIGGYVKIFGENPDEESLEGKDKNKSLANKPKLVQVAVISAGPIFNILFAWVLLTVAITFGLPASAEYLKANTASLEAKIYILDVASKSPAEKAGFSRGDQIIFASSGQDGLQLLSVKNVQDFISTHEGREVIFQVRRGSHDIALKAVPELSKENKRAIIGISLDELSVLKLPLHQAALESFRATALMTKGVTVGLFDFFAGMFQGKGDFSSVAGPVGIVSLVGDASKFGLGYFLGFTALISVNLGIINLIPFPALDGGRLLFVGIEAVTRRRISPVIVNAINAFGLTLLLILILLVTYHDISKFF
ncbi:MAG: site-2 protease family protein [Patescibacteria group bacterium]